MNSGSESKKPNQDAESSDAQLSNSPDAKSSSSAQSVNLTQADHLRHLLRVMDREVTPFYNQVVVDITIKPLTGYEPKVETMKDLPGKTLSFLKDKTTSYAKRFQRWVFEKPLPSIAPPLVGPPDRIPPALVPLGPEIMRPVPEMEAEYQEAMKLEEAKSDLQRVGHMVNAELTEMYNDVVVPTIPNAVKIKSIGELVPDPHTTFEVISANLKNRFKNSIYVLSHDPSYADLTQEQELPEEFELEEEGQTPTMLSEGIHQQGTRYGLEEKKRDVVFVIDEGDILDDDTSFQQRKTKVVDIITKSKPKTSFNSAELSEAPYPVPNLQVVSPSYHVKKLTSEQLTRLVSSDSKEGMLDRCLFKLRLVAETNGIDPNELIEILIDKRLAQKLEELCKEAGMSLHKVKDEKTYQEAKDILESFCENLGGITQERLRKLAEYQINPSILSERIDDLNGRKMKDHLLQTVTPFVTSLLKTRIMYPYQLEQVEEDNLVLIMSWFHMDRPYFVRHDDVEAFGKLLLQLTEMRKAVSNEIAARLKLRDVFTGIKIFKPSKKYLKRASLDPINEILLDYLDVSNELVNRMEGLKKR